MTETGETLILLGGAILLCVGLARVLDLSPLIASMAVGATMVNFTDHSRPALRHAVPQRTRPSTRSSSSWRERTWT